MDSHTDLHSDHTPAAISARLGDNVRHSYLGDGVLGAIDGTVTTFAIVAAASGAGLTNGVALVLGFANVCADGFSMAAGNYLRAKSDADVVHRMRRVEEHHIDTIPEGEREEVRQIFAAKGFAGDLLERVVATITEDRERWRETMLVEEHGLRAETPAPTRAALVTFGAFLLAGLVPLLGLLAFQTFPATALLTAATFFGIGVIKGRYVDGRLWASGVETLLVGGSAAAMAYGLAACTQHWA